MSDAVFFRKMAAVLNQSTGFFCLAETEREADLMLTRAMKGVPAGRIETMGFRVKAVMVTVHELPDSASVPACAAQGALFS